VKVEYKQELRRFLYTGTTFNSLLHILRELFHLQDEVVVQYKDDEDDYITMSTDHELIVALSISGSMMRIRLLSQLEAQQNRISLIETHKQLNIATTSSMFSPDKLVARHVKDVTIPDGTIMSPNTTFVKIWRIRNEGYPWPSGCHLLYISKKNGDRMGSPDVIPITTGDLPVKTNEEVEISVSLVAPANVGKYTGYWRLCSPTGRKFGQRMWVSIVVA